MIWRFFTPRSLIALLAVITFVYWQVSRGKYLLAVLWYLIFWKLFHEHPGILHPKRDKFQMKDKGQKFSHHFVAHRGGGWHAPENTLQAFKRAVDKGCHMLEMDVRMTKDKKIIVCHDANLKRLCGVDKMVSEFNFADLPKFQKSMPMHFSERLKTGDYMAYERKPSDQDSFSLLEDVFKAFPDICMSIEVKDKGNEEAARITIELIQKYKRHHLTLCASDEAWWTRRFLEIDPKLGTVFGNTDVIKLYFFYWLGLLPYLHIDREAALLPYMTRDYIVMRWNELQDAKTLGERVFFVLYIYVA
jgi:hypothetical protein